MSTTFNADGAVGISLYCCILLAGTEHQSESGSKPVLGDYKQSGGEDDQLFKPPIHFFKFIIFISALVMMTESCSERLLWSARRPTTNLAAVLRDASFPISLSNTALSQVCSCAAGSLQLLLHSGWVFFQNRPFILFGLSLPGVSSHFRKHD